MQEKGAAAYIAIAVLHAKGIVLKANPNFFTSNGSDIVHTNRLRKNIKANVHVRVENSKNIYKAQFLLDIKAVVETEDIPSSLIIKWDQTGICYIPVGSWEWLKLLLLMTIIE